VFIIGHLRGTPRPKVFPVTYNNSEDIILPTVTTRITADSNGTYVRKGQTQEMKQAKIRRLTPTECERLQGFPDGWTEGISDTQRYKCLGNAFNKEVVKHILSFMK
jgi:site-specific DNA-cytosine methylase